MSTWAPKFKLYSSDGLTLQYTFPVVINSNYPKNPKGYVEITSQRGQGSIILEGSSKPWDLKIEGILNGNDYEELITKIDAMRSTIAQNTKYVLKIDKTDSTSYSYNVKRIKSIDFPIDRNRRTTIQPYKLILRVNSWG